MWTVLGATLFALVDLSQKLIFKELSLVYRSNYKLTDPLTDIRRLSVCILYRTLGALVVDMHAKRVIFMMLWTALSLLPAL